MIRRHATFAGSAAEALLVGAAGATLAWLVGGLVQPAVGLTMALIAGANGAVSGWRQVYAWRTGRGLAALVLDSTWATLPVSAGLVAHVAARASKDRGGFERSLSYRENRHVYRGGAHFQAGFALTLGNVISSAGDVSRARRRKLITDHEAVHIWQARWFGPSYLVLYLGWTAVGALGGVLLWLRRGRLGKVVLHAPHQVGRGIGVGQTFLAVHRAGHDQARDIGLEALRPFGHRLLDRLLDA